MKVVLILDHMAENDLKPPRNAELKKHGHDLKTLFENMRSIRVSAAEHPLVAVKPSSIEYDIMEHLSNFANGARYFNLDSLSSNCHPRLRS